MYADRYVHSRWREHVVRVRRTVEIAQRLIDVHGLTSVADISAGDRAVITAVRNVSAKFATDITDGDDIAVKAGEIDPVDLLICTETIEHLEAPWTVLEKIAIKAKWLVVSTPLDEAPEIDNYEHYWSFTEEDVRDILTQSGFKVESPTIITGDRWTYAYQIWTARSEAIT